MVLSGLVPEVFTPRVVTIPTGALILNGLQPFAILNNIIDVPTGALNLQGLPPAIIISSGDQLIVVPTAQLLLQGFPPELLLEIIELPFDEQRRYLAAADGRIYCVWSDGRTTMVEPPEMRVYNAAGEDRIMEVEFDPDFKIWEVRRNEVLPDEGED
jgi:hypothetical protein